MDDVTDKSVRPTPPGPLGLKPATVENWLAEAAVPVFDAMQADPGRGIPAKDVTAAFDAPHAEWVKHGGRGA